MSFSQLCQDVMTKTGRPELVAETQLAVRQATKFVHMSNFWLRDCMEQRFDFPVVGYTFQVDTSLLARYRKLRYVKKFDLATNIPKEGESHKLSEGSPTDLFDRYQAPRSNIYYLSGSSINVKCNSQEQSLLFAWYKYPDTNPESFSSWIAEAYDPIIIDKAAANIFRDTGMTEDANRLDKYVLDIHLPVVTMNDIEATAR